MKERQEADDMTKVTLSVSKEMKRALKRGAADLDTTLSAFATDCLRIGLNHNKSLGFAREEGEQ